MEGVVEPNHDQPPPMVISSGAQNVERAAMKAANPGKISEEQILRWLREPKDDEEID